MLLDYLDRACDGQKTDLGIATVAYRRTEKVLITNPNQTIAFLEQNGHSDCIRYQDPEISKSELKALIKAGTAVPGASIQEGLSCSLR